MSLHPQQTSVIPNRIFYKLPTTTDYQSRQMTKILPANGSGTFTQNSTITIELPASGFADFKNSYLSLKAQLTNTQGNIVFDNTSCPFIKRLRIADGWNNTIEDITNYADVVAVNEKLFHTADYVNGIGSILEGVVPDVAADIQSTERINYSQDSNKRQLKLISGVLRHGMPIQYVVDLIGKMNLYDQNINTWKSGVVRALKTFIPDGTKADDHICVECETEGLVYSEGCLKCVNCGYSKCG